jgi:methionine-rich copper-binding protein CopC
VKKLIILITTLLLVPVNANAHAGLVSTSPSQGQILSEMPAEITLTFSEDLLTIANQKINTLSLRRLDGPPVGLSDITVDKSKVSARVDAGTYEDGTYEISYRIVSADGHTLSGSLTFALNLPVIATSSYEAHESFLHIHQGHITQAGVAIILIALWWAYRRFNREQGQ